MLPQPELGYLVGPKLGSQLTYIWTIQRDNSNGTRPVRGIDWYDRAVSREWIGKNYLFLGLGLFRPEFFPDFDFIEIFSFTYRVTWWCMMERAEGGTQSGSNWTTLNEKVVFHFWRWKMTFLFWLRQWGCTKLWKILYLSDMILMQMWPYRIRWMRNTRKYRKLWYTEKYGWVSTVNLCQHGLLKSACCLWESCDYWKRAQSLCRTSS